MKERMRVNDVQGSISDNHEFSQHVVRDKVRLYEPNMNLMLKKCKNEKFPQRQPLPPASMTTETELPEAD